MNYTVPASIAPFISDIYPISTFGIVSPIRLVMDNITMTDDHQTQNIVEARGAPNGCSTSVTTSTCYRSLYGFSTYKPAPDVNMNNGPAVGMCV